MGQTLGYPSKKDQCVVLENTCTVGNATLCFKDNPSGDYPVIEGNGYFLEVIFSINAYSHFFKHSFDDI